MSVWVSSYYKSSRTTRIYFYFKISQTFFKNIKQIHKNRCNIFCKSINKEIYILKDIFNKIYRYIIITSPNVKVRGDIQLSSKQVGCITMRVYQAKWYAVAMELFYVSLILRNYFHLDLMAFQLIFRTEVAICKYFNCRRKQLSVSNSFTFFADNFHFMLFIDIVLAGSLKKWCRASVKLFKALN